VLKHKRLVSIIATIAFCLSFLAPALLAPAPAVAASSYSVLTTQNVSKVGDTITDVAIQIDVPTASALKPGSLLTINLPAALEMPNAAAGAFGGDVVVSAPSKLSSTEENALVKIGVAPAPDVNYFIAYPVGKANIEVKIPTAAEANALGLPVYPGVNAIGAGRIIVSLNNVKVIDTIDGDIKAKIYSPTSSGFSSGEVVLGKFIGSSTGTYTSVTTVKSMGAAGVILDTITISETVAGSLKATDKIKFKLPNGFKWVLNPTDPAGNLVSSKSTAAWGLQGAWDTTNNGLTLTDNDRSLILDLAKDNGTPFNDIAGEARIYNAGLKVVVEDEAVAKKGDVTVTVSNSAGESITEQTVVVAKYADYEVTVADKTPKEVMNGFDDIELGSFTITEGLAGSILPNRTINLTLPDGVKWDDVNYTGTTIGNNAVISRTHVKGTDWAQNLPYSVSSDKQVLKITTPANGTTAAAVTEFDKLRVKISPSFTGDVKLVVSGAAGVSGEVKVGTVKPRVELTAENPKDIVIGMQAQATADVLIKENVKEAIKYDTTQNPAQKEIQLSLPGGSAFAAVPTVTVDGDLIIDKVSLTNDYNDLLITLKGSSTAPATIKISDIKVTADRTLPEGDFRLTLVGAYNGVLKSTSLTNTAQAFNEDTISSVVIGKCVTPAGEQGRSASFYIGSTIMNVNGSNIIMDAAPYIKAGRTYVPVRYLGDALGATTAWDEATKTVTVTKGDNTVVLVIGSTIAKVNGADVQMDVAPEITGVGRTMLPARWVAEGLGYQVGWNAALQQVVIQ